MGFLQEIIPLRGSILQAGTCKILSLAENPRWSRVWQLGGSGLEISIFNVKCRLNGGKIREENWYPGYRTGGRKPVPFEEYIPLLRPGFVNFLVCLGAGSEPW